MTDPAVIEDEAGRTAIGTYLKVPPGETSLHLPWTSPYAADAKQRWTYRLTIQAQPGMLPGPLNRHDPGACGEPVMASSQGAHGERGDGNADGHLDRDIVVGLRYGP